MALQGESSLSNEVDKYFAPELQAAIRAASSSPHPMSQQLIKSMERLAYVLGDDTDIAEKVGVGAGKQRPILLGYADCDFLAPQTEIFIDVNSLTTNLAIFGSVGMGKTTHTKFTLRQLDAYGIPWWVFSLKGEFLHLCKEKNTLLVVPGEGEVPINPLFHPLDSNWPERIAEITSSAFELGQVSESNLTGLIWHVMNEFKLTQPDLPACSLYELRIAVARAKENLKYKDQVMINYLTRIEDRISSILNTSVGQDFGCYDGVPIEALMNRNVVFDMRNVTEQYLSFYINLLLTWIFQYLINSNKSPNGTRLLLCLDEGEDLMLNNVGVRGIDLTTRYFKLFREYGVGILFTSHSFEALRRANPIVSNNSGVLVMLGMNNASDAVALGRTMGFTPDDFRLIPMLGVGRGIVKIANVERPIQFTFPGLEREPFTHDDIVVARQRTKSFVGSFDIHNVPDREREYVFTEVLKPAYHSRTVEEKKEESASRLLEFTKEFVTCIHEHPGWTYSRISNALSFGGSKETVNSVKAHCLEEDLAFEVQKAVLESENRRPPSRLGLLPKGFELIDAKPEGNGKGHLQGIFWNAVAAVYDRKGIRVVGENYENRADLYLYPINAENDVRHAVEISVRTTASDEIRNAKRDLAEKGCLSVTVIVVQLQEVAGKKNVYVTPRNSEDNKKKAFLEAFHKELDDETLKKVNILTFDEFRKQNDEEIANVSF